MRPSHLTAARAFSLLEVILALAVLGVALASLGAVLRLAHENALRAVREAEALVLAENLMAELVSGVRSLSAQQNLSLSDPGTSSAQAAPTHRDAWVGSITIGEGPISGLVSATARVELAQGAVPPRVVVSITRWFRDPALAASSGSASSL